MTTKEYDNLSLAYQFLTKRFDMRQDYYYNNFYRCYDSNCYGVREERLETLKCFENLTFRDLYKNEHIDSHYYGDNYLDAKVVVIKDNQVCILPELGQVIFYILISKLEIGIRQFQKLLLDLSKNDTTSFRQENNGEKIIVDINLLENVYKNQFENIENYKFIIHLFGKTNSGIIMLKWNYELEINLSIINTLLDTLTIFDFSKVDL